MAKSIRSKIKKRFRTIKRAKDLAHQQEERQKVKVIRYWTPEGELKERYVGPRSGITAAGLAKLLGSSTKPPAPDGVVAVEKTVPVVSTDKKDTAM